eukprot:Blabericola_migrator_1__7760@NODE_396_length_8973_cov_12_789355_g315_i0_p2_GENE_NODE_396_length_8973_cov_12_789355_g315_i0NODE_396_length_8973_cov_12_789355_g315_i0_p2_ORF_typecomplete_len331_score47_02_NODE_396_length_8973_cov_12_789355_g315_i078428834
MPDFVTSGGFYLQLEGFLSHQAETKMRGVCREFRKTANRQDRDQELMRECLSRSLGYWGTVNKKKFAQRTLCPTTWLEANLFMDKEDMMMDQIGLRSLSLGGREWVHKSDPDLNKWQTKLHYLTAAWGTTVKPSKFALYNTDNFDLCDFDRALLTPSYTAWEGLVQQLKAEGANFNVEIGESSRRNIPIAYNFDLWNFWPTAESASWNVPHIISRIVKQGCRVTVDDLLNLETEECIPEEDLEVPNVLFEDLWNCTANESVDKSGLRMWWFHQYKQLVSEFHSIVDQHIGPTEGKVKAYEVIAYEKTSIKRVTLHVGNRGALMQITDSKH